MSNNFIKQEISKSGDITLKYKNWYLHSKYNPKIEAEKFVKKSYKKASIQILIGYGAGYIYDELKKMIVDDEKILVVDPIIKLEEQEGFLTNFNLEYIKKFLNTHISVIDTINLIVSINYEMVMNESEELALFYKMLNEKIYSSIISENTISYFTTQWNENYLKNLKYAGIDNSIKELFSKRSEPVVVASGGPSLTKQLPLIKKFRNKIILIAAGTTINSLLSNDIRPDLVVAVDGGEINHQHFKDLKINDFPLVYTPTVHPGVRASFKNGLTCLLSMEEQLIAHYEKYSNKKVETLIGGSSVANFAYNLALFMTSGPVALVGQDLAYTNGESHAKGNLNFSKVKDKQFKLEEGYYGKKVETDNVFLQMRDGFELILDVMQAKDVSYNCTEGGLKIPSFKQVPFETFLLNYAKEEVECNWSFDNQSDNDLLVLNYKKDIKFYEKLIRLFNDALSELKKNHSNTHYDMKILKNLNKIDEKIQDYVKELNLQYAYSNVNLNLVKYFKVANDADEKTKYEISYKQNLYMYEEMLKITKDSLLIVKSLIKEIGD